MNFTRRLTQVIAYAAPFFMVPAFALAAGGLTNPVGTTDIYQFLQNLLKLIAQIAFPVVVLFFVYIGFLFIGAQGNPEKINKARNYFFWAIVGALLVLGAYALSLAIQATVKSL
jgi:hypothetical protein